MSPCLVPSNSPLGQLEGGTNMVVIEGDAVGQIVLRGAGAGEGPTASAILGDVIDIARGLKMPVFGAPAASLREAGRAGTGLAAAHYLRLSVQDAPGVLAKVTTALSDQGISINEMRQPAHGDGEAEILIVTHPCARAALDTALEAVEASGVCRTAPVALRIESV